MPSAQGLSLVSAGAGSGKTHRLTEVVTAAVRPGDSASIELRGLVAVTYTRKAAAELETRIRQSLIFCGAPEVARELPLAQLGTVHSVCLRWLREFALDAGLSPLSDVLPGDEVLALRQALEVGLPAELRARLDSLAGQLEIRWDARSKRWDWLDPVQNVMTLARGNRMRSTALRAMGERSSEGLRALMGAPESSADVLDAALAQALVDALASLRALEGGPKKLDQARRDLESARRRLEACRFPWSGWVALQKLDGGKLARSALAPLAEVARRVDRHPRLHGQLHQFIELVYEAAAVGLAAYDLWKRQRRLVDFVDMVDQGLTLFEVPEVGAELQRRLGLCAVDEFQDTSPAQLALFIKLHRLCGRSVWVGDPKQCIFEYAGADPELMQAVTNWVERAGGASETRGENRRSRPELVDSNSRLFTAAFAKDGYRPEQVAMSPGRPAIPALDVLPPFAVWWLEGTNREHAIDAMADGICRMLRNRSDTPVVDRASQRPRTLLPGDIAVLVATNAEAVQVTTALNRRGLRAAVARTGLLATPEGTLVKAALSYVVDRKDTRSLAVVEALTGFGGETPDSWLEAKIAQHVQTCAAPQHGESVESTEQGGIAATLRSVREVLFILSPAEALDRVLVALDVARLGARWPEREQHLSNIEALRALAARYEARCRHQREAASVSGLLRYFDEATTTVLVQDEERASDDQFTGQGPDCITVTTYHRAKGLEWPVVILGSLDRRERRDAFSVLPESSEGAFDPTEPLGGRWIRYWPWPYGQHANAPLADAAAASSEGRRVQSKEERERVRLLYVGFTRARDHLILAVRRGRQGANAAWLDELRDSHGVSLISLPELAPDALSGHLGIRGIDGVMAKYPARVWGLQPVDAVEPISTSTKVRWFARAGKATAPTSRYIISPSRAQHEWSGLELGDAGEHVIVGSRLPLRSESPKDWNRVGETLHAFLAADLEEVPEDRRLICAQRLLTSSGLLELIEPMALVHAADGLRDWVAKCWPDAIWHRELPVSGLVSTPHGNRRIEGIIDLLLEVDGGVVLIDHKSYPGRRDTCRDKAREHAPQLAAYARALTMAGRNVLSQWIAFVVSGAMVQVNQRGRAFRAAAIGG